MKDKHLYALWGGLYILCAFLGAIEAPEGLLKALLVLLAVGFFVPGGVLLYRGIGAHDRKAVGRIRNIALIWLGATVIMMVLNILSVNFSQTAGDWLYALLVLVSSPMVCGRYWVVTLFLWACLLFTALTHMPKK